MRREEEGRGKGGQESSTLVDKEEHISQGIKEIRSQNADLQLGFMSKIRANSCPGIKNHPSPGLHTTSLQLRAWRLQAGAPRPTGVSTAPPGD